MYLASGDSRPKRRPSVEQLLQRGRPQGGGIGRGHAQDRLHEPPHLHHRLAVLVVGLGVQARVAGDLPARARVVVHAPEVVAARAWG